jgi:hypothetical protein
MTNLTIDLLKNPEIKDLVATMSPGDPIKIHAVIKDVDDQTLVATVTSAQEGDPVPEEEKEPGAEDKAAEGDTVNPPPAGPGGDAVMPPEQAAV